MSKPDAEQKSQIQADGPGAWVEAMGAISAKNKEALLALMEAGQWHPSRIGHSGESILHTMAQFGHTEFARFAIEHGASIDARMGSLLLTPAHIAARHLRREMLDALAEAGADFDLPDRFGETATQMLCAEHMPEDARLYADKARAAREQKAIKSALAASAAVPNGGPIGASSRAENGAAGKAGEVGEGSGALPERLSPRL
jgi:hypothetical protein